MAELLVVAEWLAVAEWLVVAGWHVAGWHVAGWLVVALIGRPVNGCDGSVILVPHRFQIFRFHCVLRWNQLIQNLYTLKTLLGPFTA